MFNLFFFLIIGSQVLLPSLFAVIETKRFDAKTPERSKYLNYMMPQGLRFSEPILQADRGNLLVLNILPAPVVEDSAPIDANKSVDPVFPIIPYEESDNSFSTPDETSQLDSNNLDNEETLPLADPFEEMSNSSIDSTDDLMEVFESSSSSQSMLQGQGGIIPFIPPYSVTPDNLKITNRATYRRVQR